MDLSTLNPQEMQNRVNAHPFWYHTMDIVPGVTTPGWFDLRPAVNTFPWPDVEGKRCLDIGTFDGFLAFELERRGASEVVAIDVEDHLLWDWPPDYRAVDLPRDPGFTGPPKGSGFRLAKQLKGSAVDWRPLSVYDLRPEELGTFDVVVMGSLLIHLRDPVRALEAVRSVTKDYLMSTDQIELGLTFLRPHKPLYRLNGSGGECQWFNFNASGHKRLLYAAGFEILSRGRPYVERFNVHPKPPRTPSNAVRALGFRALTGTFDPGVLHQALLARPRI